MRHHTTDPITRISHIVAHEEKIRMRERMAKGLSPIEDDWPQPSLDMFHQLSSEFQLEEDNEE